MIHKLPDFVKSNSEILGEVALATARRQVADIQCCGFMVGTALQAIAAGRYGLVTTAPDNGISCGFVGCQRNGFVDNILMRAWSAESDVNTTIDDIDTTDIVAAGSTI